jgi:PadR family transcriptional regulator, regulatory protein AphA
LSEDTYTRYLLLWHYLPDIYLAAMVKQPTANSRTTTADALMGLLSLGPMSGYQLRQLIDESIGNFWTESYGQIYPTLRRLAAEGMVTVKTERAEGRAERKVYTLTKAGHNRLRDWLNLPPQQQVPRNDLLLKLFFGGLVSIDVVARHVESFRAVQHERLQQYTAIADELKRRYARHSNLPFWLMTTSYGLHEARALSDWCDETLAQCQKMKKSKTLRVVKSTREQRGA